MCPLCRSKAVRRSYPKARDFLFLVFRVRPMRCRTCHRRFYHWPWSTPVSTLSPAPAPPPKLTAFKPLRKSSAAASGKS
jgi:hypothetical protein